MDYLIKYNIVLNCGTLSDKEIKVKNKDNELFAKCALEDYLRRKYKEEFKQLVIISCNKDYFLGNDLFNDILNGRQF